MILRVPAQSLKQNHWVSYGRRESIRKIILDEDGNVRKLLNIVR